MCDFHALIKRVRTILVLKDAKDAKPLLCCFEQTDIEQQKLRNKRIKARNTQLTTMPEHGVTKRLQHLMGSLLVRNDELKQIIEKEIEDQVGFDKPIKLQRRKTETSIVERNKKMVREFAKQRRDPVSLEQRKREKEEEWMHVYQKSIDIASNKGLVATQKYEEKQRALQNLSQDQLRERIALFEKNEKLKKIESMITLGIFFNKLDEALTIGRQRRVHLVTFDPNDIVVGYPKLLQICTDSMYRPPPPPPATMHSSSNFSNTLNTSTMSSSPTFALTELSSTTMPLVNKPPKPRQLTTAQEAKRSKHIAKAIKYAKEVFDIHIANVRSSIALITSKGPLKPGNPLVISFVLRSKRIQYSANTIRNFIRNNDMGLQLFNCIGKFRYRVYICQRQLRKFRQRYMSRMKLLELLFSKCDKRRLSTNKESIHNSEYSQNLNVNTPIPHLVRHQICKLIFENQRKTQLEKMLTILNSDAKNRQRQAANVKTPSLVKEIEMMTIVNSVAQQYAMNLKRDEKGEAMNDYYLPILTTVTKFQAPLVPRQQQIGPQGPSMLQRLTRVRTKLILSRAFITDPDADDD